MSDLRVGDIGAIFEATILQNGGLMNVSAATTKEFIFLSPSGSRLTKTAALVTDGTDGKIKYSSLAADFTESGNWAVQARIVIGINDYKSTIETFKVGKAL